MTVPECLHHAVSFLHGLSFLVGAACGFVLCVGFGVVRKIRVVDAEVEELRKRVAKGAGQ